MIQPDSTASEPAMTVLICEDEAIVALDIALMVEDLGFKVLGTCASVAEGRKMLENGLPDTAILDVRLRDGEVFPLAQELHARGVDLIFHSGHVIEDEIRRDFPGAGFCPKPTTAHRLRSCFDRFGQAEMRMAES